jgi:tetratricopeptide (TPR) repeat protein
LNDAIDWYKRGHEIAPQDVTILNEYASAVALMGNYLTNQQKAAEAAPYYQQASDLFAQSKALDPNYPDTALRQAELLRLQGNIAQAVDSYLALLKANPHAIDNQVSLLADSLRSQPDQLTRLRDAYASASQQNPNDATLQSFIGLLSVRLNDMPRAATAFARWTELQPESLDARRNYTLVLSETQQYAQAVTQAQGLLALAQKQRVAQDQLTLYQNLVSFFTAKAQGG